MSMRPCSTVSIQIVALSTDGAAGLSRDRPNVVSTIATRAIPAGKYFFRFGGGSLAISKDSSPKPAGFHFYWTMTVCSWFHGNRYATLVGSAKTLMLLHLEPWRLVGLGCSMSVCGKFHPTTEQSGVFFRSVARARTEAVRRRGTVAGQAAASDQRSGDGIAVDSQWRRSSSESRIARLARERPRFQLRQSVSWKNHLRCLNWEISWHCSA